MLFASAQRFESPSLLRDHPAVAYLKTPPQDPVSALGQRLESGDLTLRYEPANGYLRSVLDALGISTTSQLLVFSKTSFQAPRITPANPRALFFNDSVAVGWVRGGEVLELMAQDPRQGTMFYTLQQDPAAPRLQRNASCLSCHTSEATAYVPGWFLGSVFPAPDGTTTYGPAYTTDHRMPFMLRWGGWYVTGSHAIERHQGNAVVTNPSDLAAMVTPATLHVDSLEDRFDRTGYPGQFSDIVALLVLEHQATMHNLITRAGWEARAALAASRGPSDTIADLVNYLLFVDEAPLSGPVAGRSGFAAWFSAQGPRDSKGRSLRDFDLTSRLMRYPCSYLIYSPAFDALPDDVRSAVYARMWQVLSGADAGPRYSTLSATDREAVIEILSETKPGLPAYFKPASPASSAE